MKTGTHKLLINYVHKQLKKDLEITYRRRSVDEAY